MCQLLLENYRERGTDFRYSSFLNVPTGQRSRMKKTSWFFRLKLFHGSNNPCQYSPDLFLCILFVFKCDRSHTRVQRRPLCWLHGIAMPSGLLLIPALKIPSTWFVKHWADIFITTSCCNSKITSAMVTASSSLEQQVSQHIPWDLTKQTACFTDSSVSFIFPHSSFRPESCLHRTSISI